MSCRAEGGERCEVRLVVPELTLNTLITLTNDQLTPTRNWHFILHITPHPSLTLFRISWQLWNKNHCPTIAFKGPTKITMLYYCRKDGQYIVPNVKYFYTHSDQMRLWRVGRDRQAKFCLTMNSGVNSVSKLEAERDTARLQMMMWPPHHLVNI